MKKIMNDIVNLFAFLILIVVFGCQGNKPLLLKQPFEDLQDFSIRCDRDTTLIDKHGVKIKINANTFQCPDSGEIKLQFAAIIEKVDIIKSGFSTVDNEGKFLESAGMFKLINKSSPETNFSKPVTLEIPTEYVTEKMEKYILDDSNSIVTWRRSKKKLRIKNHRELKEGKKLFQNSCSSCHSENLRISLTGPPLGNVHLFREKDWLTKFTKNSQKLIAEKDSIALCIWQDWQPNVMNNFEHLTDNQINLIYKYIANESRVQNIKKNEISYKSECEIVEREFENLNPVTISRGLFIQDGNRVFFYEMDLINQNWVNADFLASENSDEIDPIIVSFDKAYQNMSVFLVFEERNIVIPFVSNNFINFELWHPIKKDKIDFPLGEKVKIIAYSDEADAFKFGILDFMPSKTNNEVKMELTVGNKKEFFNQIKKL